MECVEADLDLEYCQNLIKRLLKLAIQTKSIKYKKFSNSLNDVFRRIVIKSWSIAEREARQLRQCLNGKYIHKSSEKNPRLYNST